MENRCQRVDWILSLMFLFQITQAIGCSQHRLLLCEYGKNLGQASSVGSSFLTKSCKKTAECCLLGWDIAQNPC